jgi:hypothetical protein
MGAASFIDGNRFTRPSKLQEYVSWLDRLEAEGFHAATVTVEDNVQEAGEEVEEERDEKDGDMQRRRLLELEEPADSPDNFKEIVLGTSEFSSFDDNSSAANSAANGLVAAADGNILNEINNSNDGDSPPIRAIDSSSRPNDVDVLEVVMLALRTSDGLDLAALGKRYGWDVVDKVLTGIKPFVPMGQVAFLPSKQAKSVGDSDNNRNCDSSNSSGNSSSSSSDNGKGDMKAIKTLSDELAAIDVERESVVRLTDPDGFLLSNDIISSVFAELS